MAYDDLKQFEELDYPRDAHGSCLIVGTPSIDRAEEPLAVDMARAVFASALRTRANLPAGTRTRIEVIGALPRALMVHEDPLKAFRTIPLVPQARRDTIDPEEAAVREALRHIQETTLGKLRRIEDNRTLQMRALVNEYQLSDVDVVSLTEKLETELDAGMEFLGDFSFMRNKLNMMLTIPRPGIHGEETESIELRNTLINLIPGWIKRHADAFTLDRLINYAIVELLRIIRKAMKGVLLYHYSREKDYLRLAKAYMAQAIGISSAEAEKIDRFVKMPSDIEGLKLLYEEDSGGQELTPDAIDRMTKCEPYRIGQRWEGRRIFLYPGDKPDVMRAKVLSPHIPDDQKQRYFNEMIVPILKMVRMFIQNQRWAREKFDALLPNDILYDEANYPLNADQLFKALYELVIAPVEQMIDSMMLEREKLAGLQSQVAAPAEVFDEPPTDRTVTAPDKPKGNDDEGEDT